MKKAIVVAAAIMLVCLGGIAQATITIEAVTVGDAWNTADTTGYGAVNHNYNIGKYKVTVDQYVEFLDHHHHSHLSFSPPQYFWDANHIARSGSGTDADPYSYSVDPLYANNPVIYVSYWDACRFVNWLGNGQGDGDTETGAYTLDGYNGSAGGDIIANPGARWVIPTIDEWYKAAYYRGGTNAGYYDEPTASAYGTVDQYGNGWEWSESVVSVGPVDSRILGGGPVEHENEKEYKECQLCDPSYRQDPAHEKIDDGLGFRVAEVPEPSSIIALAGGLISLLGIRRRKA